MSNIFVDAQTGPKLASQLDTMRSAANAYWQSVFMVSRPGCVRVGQVVRADAGYYAVQVRSPNSTHDTMCNVGGDMALSYSGAQTCCIPPVGSQVLYWTVDQSSTLGTVLRVFPHPHPIETLSKDGKQQPYQSYDLWDMEPGVTCGTEDPHFKAWEQPTDFMRMNSNSSRPTDLFPGDYAVINENGVGLAVLALIAALRGSEKAKVECSLIDDLVRITSGFFKHSNSQGVHQIYNDNGYLTQEQTAAMYQFEKFGLEEYGQNIIKDDGIKKKFLSNPSDPQYKLTEEQAQSVQRLHEFMGFLGTLYTRFVMDPSETAGQETYPKQTKYKGLARTHIDASGRISFASAAGISLQRTDVIPVPKRLKEPWDPAGDKPKWTGDGKPKKREPYDYPDDHPSARGLLTREVTFWYDSLIYQRFTEQVKDWYMPKPSQLRPLTDMYDRFTESEEKFSKNKNRQSFINQEADGSIILRDNWGAEIVMSGGNITLNAAGNVYVRSGKSTVVLGGDDVIVKAKNSVDVTATDHDVRIKGDRNVQILAEGRKSKLGGILIESRSPRAGLGSGTYGGENAALGGIVIKAKDSAIAITSPITRIHGSRVLSLDGRPDMSPTAECTGVLQIGVNMMLASAKQIGLTAGQNSALVLTRNYAILSGPAAYLIAGRRAAVTEGAKAWIPKYKVDITGQLPYPQIQRFATDMWTNYQIAEDWLNPFAPTVVKDFTFSYRTTDQYGTVRASEVYGATAFRVYQASWAAMKSSGSMFIQGQKTAWMDYPINGEYAWPGAGPYAGQPYYQLGEEKNVGNKAAGVPADDPVNKPADFSGKSFNEYEVMQT